jgi:hypothetical protein
LTLEKDQKPERQLASLLDLKGLSFITVKV